MKDRRAIMKRVKRLVVKVGTSILTNRKNRLDASYLEELVEDIAGLRNRGLEVSLVTSGAIAAGLKSLKLASRPRDLASLQAAAAIGQSNLMRTYERLFKEQGYLVGQVLLTRDVVNNRDRFGNARNTLDRLLSCGVVPIINENDAVAVEEIRFGDNDTLSALVLKLTAADLLIILSDVDGLQVEGRLCPEVARIDARISRAAQGSQSDKTVGGMTTKLEAARLVTAEGKPMIIANGREERILNRILDGEKLGTFFRPAG
ncbi:MAG TPA: glutamate 5-kinase [bacterium]|uniref:Glutamate 5-kinase n=1 Tax=candidate division TA06 bacterium ADurb.Bin417 TaxID=1852828 RepID=A0A1V5MHB3_UNCT6|nr:MAG: Glutamate 5-kinase 1 [candidate division TA06 bacterium ADurb.Bin417]HNQ34855.1 glutamate 5-kinase [bacterium]HNS48723.1 glutamate 5-kinase [bacterium]